MRVVLVGEVFEGSENLALAMLEASLLARGHRVFRVALGQLFEIDATAREVLALRPGLIGLSINYQLNALTALALGHQLRQLGYTGHLTAGGEFATIHPEEILRDCPLDSLIRFDGELPLAELADALERGESAPVGIPGLIPARPSNGQAVGSSHAPARVWDQPFPFWAARRPPQPKHLGIPSAAILGSRGCSYHCVYCCISALNRTASKQAKVAGKRREWESTRQRPPADLADEMEHLYREHGVRLFRFEDDCLLGKSPQEAVPIVESLSRELERRGVGRGASGQIGLTLKLRPDSLDRDVVRRLAELGLIHAFIGVEALTDPTLKRLGRSYRTGATLEALDALEEYGVPAYFNALIIGPDATLETLSADLDALEPISSQPLEIVRLILYDGTPMFRRLEARDAVHGNYLHWRYDFADPGVEAVARILARIPSRRTGVYCVAKRLADLEFNLAVADRFYERVDTRAMHREMADLKRDSNRDAVELVRDLIGLAAGRPSRDEQLELADRLAAEVGARDERYFQRIEALVRQLEEAVSRDGKQPRLAYLRSGLAAAGVCFQLAMAPAGQPLPSGSDTTMIAQEEPSATEPQSMPSEPGPTTAPTEPETEPAPVSPACTELVTAPDDQGRLYQAGQDCGAISFCDHREFVFVVDADGLVVHVKTTTGPVPEHERRCILDALSGVCFPDMADSFQEEVFFGPCD